MAHTANGFARPTADEVYVLPTTVGQQGFWYLDQLQPGNPAYNIAVRFRLQGSLQVQFVERALNEIVGRHETLRTVVTVVDGVPMQVVAPRLAISLQRDDLRGGPETDRRQRAETITAEEARGRFDLARGPLIRARLLRLEDEEHVLLVTVHHAVADGWSIGVLTQELGALYDAYRRGPNSPLPELAIQYGDFAIWQEQWLASKNLDDQVNYWVRQLANLPTLEVPTDRPRPPRQRFRGLIDSILLPRELTARLAVLANREKATPCTVLLAAFQLLLQRYTGQNDIFVGSVLAGRPRPELEPLIGLFINPLVLRTDLGGDPPFLGLLARVRQTVLAAFAHQDVPFERVVEAVQPKRDPSRHPVFQINFLYQRDFVQPFQASGLTLTAIPSVSPGSMYDLNFFLVERAEGLRASCEYDTDLYEASTIRRFLGHFQSLLEGIAVNPGCRISEFPLPTADREPPPPVATREIGEGDQVELAPPRDPVESRLLEVWEEVLGIKGISITTDFFDAGGHSLLAARLLAQVEKVFGKRVPLADLLQWPTIESLAPLLRTEEVAPAQARDPSGGGPGAEKWLSPAGQVFPLRREGTRPPLLLVDAGPFHRPLVRRLGSDQPVFGVALPELSALPKRLTVNDVAANLVEALCASPVDGPYHLAGWSQAGVIAYEMAQQLRTRGKEVGMVILLDANSPDYLRSFRGWKNALVRGYFWLEKVLYHLVKMRGLSWRGAWQYFRERRGRFDLKALEPGSDPSEEAPLDSWKVQYLAAADYHPAPCAWPLVLFRSEVLQTGRFRDPGLGWGQLARGGLQVYGMPGEHDAMFLEPDVERLASLIGECLATGNQR